MFWLEFLFHFVPFFLLLLLLWFTHFYRCTFNGVIMIINAYTHENNLTMNLAVNGDWTILRCGANASFVDIRRAKFTFKRFTGDWFNECGICAKWTWWIGSRSSNTKITTHRHSTVSSLYTPAIFTIANWSYKCLEWIQIEIWSICWKTI